MENIGNEPIILPDNPTNDKPADKPLKLNLSTNRPIGQVITATAIIDGGKKKERSLTNRQHQLCRFIAEGLTNSKAYAMAYNVKYEGNEAKCQTNVSAILSRDPKLLIEIERLNKIRIDSIVKNAPAEMSKLFPKAIDTYNQLLDSGTKESVKASIATRIIDQALPKISRHMSVKVNVPADEWKRRKQLLAE